MVTRTCQHGPRGRKGRRWHTLVEAPLPAAIRPDMSPHGRPARRQLPPAVWRVACHKCLDSHSPPTRFHCGPRFSSRGFSSQLQVLVWGLYSRSLYLLTVIFVDNRPFLPTPAVAIAPCVGTHFSSPGLLLVAMFSSRCLVYVYSLRLVLVWVFYSLRLVVMFSSQGLVSLAIFSGQ